jgi:BASS family bile acid:Na+ symporter
VFSIAVIVNVSMAHFLQQNTYVPLQFSKVLEVCYVVILPVGLGMIIRNRAPKLTQKLEQPVKIISAIFLALIIILAGLRERDHLWADLKTVGLAAFIFNISCLSLGYYIPLFFKLSKKQAIAIGMEIGIHNGTLAIYIALNVIGIGAMTVPAVVYSIIMFLTAAVFAWIVNVRQRPVSS